MKRNRLNAKLANHAQGLLRRVMVRGFSQALHLVVVNEYPKSGGTWLGGMLGDALDLPFPRNRVPPFRRCIVHGHFLVGNGRAPWVVLWRDGRDVMVSYYHHCYFENDRFNAPLVAAMQRALPIKNPEDVRRHLPAFVERVLTRPVYPRFTWQDFVDRWYGQSSAIHVKYEHLLRNAKCELQRIIDELGDDVPVDSVLEQVVDSHTFSKRAGRRSGMEDKTAFLRKGIAGDWKNHFTRETSEVFDHFAGAALIQMGYEADRNWVNEVDE